MIKPVKSTFAFFPLFSWPNKTFTFCLFFAWKVFSTKVGWVFSSDEKGNEKVFFESDGTAEEGTEHKMDADKKLTDDRLRERWVSKREITGKEVRMKRNEYKEDWVKKHRERWGRIRPKVKSFNTIPFGWVSWRVAV